ncbi:MAG: hypothetical protein GX046_09740 [Tissierellia bacterium]|nr:hypothetical protein [Tissierellia bacterium]
MKNLFVLVKKDIYVDYPYIINPAVAFKDKKLRKKTYLQVFGYLVIFIYLMLFMKPIFKLYDVYKDLGMALGFLSLGFMAYLMVLLLFSFPYILSKIYFSRDVQMTLSLPVSPEEILQSKLISLSFSSLIYGVITVVPIMLKFGIAEKMGPLYYIYGFLGLILLCLGIISLLAFVLIFLMRWVARLPKLKNVVQFFGMMLILVFSLGINYFIQSTVTGDPVEMMNKIAQGSKALLDAILPAIPTLRWLLLAMEKSSSLIGLGYFLLLLLSTLAVVVILTKLGAPFMVQGVLSSTAVGEKKLRRRGKNNSSSVAVHIFKKEFSELLRTPLYAFNTLGGALILPIALLIPLFAQKTISFDDIKEFRDIIPFLPFTRFELILLGVSLGIALGVFMGSMGNPLSSSFSREGKQIWIMKVLPISAKDQILGRFMVGMSFQLLLLIPILVLGIIVFLPPVELVLAIIGGNLLAGVFVSLLGLSVDTTRPKLVWDNPQEAMKQNFNLVITMFTLWAYLGIMGFILFNIKVDPLAKLPLILGIVIISQLILDAALYIYLNKTMESALLRMQD